MPIRGQCAQVTRTFILPRYKVFKENIFLIGEIDKKKSKVTLLDNEIFFTISLKNYKKNCKTLPKNISKFFLSIFKYSEGK